MKNFRIQYVTLLSTLHLKEIEYLKKILTLD